MHESEGRVQFERLSKTYECMFYQIALETILLLVNNIQMIIYNEIGQEYTNILTFSRKTLFSNVHAMILELKHINQTSQSLNSSIKVMHLLENQENNQNILQDSPAMFVFVK